MVRLGWLNLLASASISFAAACGASDDASSTPSTTNGTGTAASKALSSADCTRRCEAKLTTCQAPSADAEQGCAQLCGSAISEAQASCFEATDCTSIARSASVASLCPAGGGTATTTTPDAGTPPASSLPTVVTITAKLPSSAAATHVSKSDGTIVSFFTASGAPSFSPSLNGSLPNLADRSIPVAVSSPSLDTCAATFAFTLNGGQVSVQISGSDTGTSNACGAFTDAVARDGLELVLSRVPYQSTPSATSTVTLKLSK